MTTSQLQIAKEALEKIKKYYNETSIMVDEALKEISSMPDEKEDAIEDELWEEVVNNIGDAVTMEYKQFIKEALQKQFSIHRK